MPPEAKYTREQIRDKAFELVRKEGMEALTARGLAAVLGTSPRPVFTAWGSIEAVREAVIQKAQELYTAYIEEGLAATPPFKGVGTQFIRFAAEEPVFFRLLFMTPHANAGEEDAQGSRTGPSMPIGNAIAGMDLNYDKILHSVMKAYDLSEAEGARIYEHLGVYSHGYAVMIATGMARYDPEAASEQLTDVFTALLLRLKSQKKSMPK